MESCRGKKMTENFSNSDLMNVFLLVLLEILIFFFHYSPMKKRCRKIQMTMANHVRRNVAE